VQQVAILFAGTQGLLDDVDVQDLRAFEDGFYTYMDSSQAQVLADIETKKALDDDIKARLKAAIEEYKKDFLAARKDAAKETAKA
jgi:F-type H+-transporting ATPase subunit alpha